MNKLIVQIYEVQDPFEAEKLIELGVDYIGSVVLSETDWKIPALKDVVKITSSFHASNKSSIIPLFNKMDSVFRVIDYYQPHIIHFTENILDADLKLCEYFVNLQYEVKKRFDTEITRAIPIYEEGVKINDEDVEKIFKLAGLFEPVSDYFLTDTVLIHSTEDNKDYKAIDGFVGITGKICNWNIAQNLVQSSKIPVILAGGISHNNAAKAIKEVSPFGIDSCTGTNVLDKNGRNIRFKKDMDKVKRLLDEVRDLT
ncbi:MAG: hypothetical protein HQK76_13315 [Desulfobacterales bacterium]|nr:hypothetical protein [Desulfobacterales bacterium]